MDSSKKVTKEQFAQLVNTLRQVAKQAMRECDMIHEDSLALVEHDPHLAKLYMAQAKAQRAIFEYVTRKDVN